MDPMVERLNVYGGLSDRILREVRAIWTDHSGNLWKYVGNDVEA